MVKVGYSNIKVMRGSFRIPEEYPLKVLVFMYASLEKMYITNGCYPMR